MDLAAIKRWRAMLEQMPKDARAELVNEIQPIVIDGKAATLLAAPLFLLPETYEKVVTAAETFVDAAVTIESSPDFKPGQVIYDRLYNSLSDSGKKLIDRSGTVTVTNEAIKRRFRRLDGFLLSDQTPTFIEMNQSAPLAISFYEGAKQLVTSIADRADMAIGESSDLYSDLAEWFVSELRVGGHGGKSATIAVSMERGYLAKFVDLPVACDGIAAAAQKQGVELTFILAEPTEFTWDGTRGYAKGASFDLLWRNTVYLQNYPETLTEYEAIRYGETPMVNDLQSWLFRSKEFFAIIWDDAMRSELTRFGIDVEKVRAVTPRTVSLYQLNEDEKSRSDWVIKRCDDGFGKGIVFGSELTRAEWAEYISGQHGTDWIAQEIVRPLASELPIILPDGSVESVKCYCDIDPFVVNGNVSGILVRALPVDTGTDRKMNIVEGAAIGCAMPSSVLR